MVLMYEFVDCIRLPPEANGCLNVKLMDIG